MAAFPERPGEQNKYPRLVRDQKARSATQKARSCEALQKSGIDPQRRAETLSVDASIEGAF